MLENVKMFLSDRGDNREQGVFAEAREGSEWRSESRMEGEQYGRREGERRVLIE